MPVHDYGFYLNRAVSAAQPAQVSQGASGYFSAPQKMLDPHIFDGDHVKPDVRDQILTALYKFWDGRFHQAHVWSTVWLAGSGISYQWAGDRGNGDLDVLIGVDWPQFRECNPNAQGLSDAELANVIDEELRIQLWPRTANTNHHGQVYEQTYYVNAGGTDIRDLNPYAAYNLTTDNWTVRPPQLPDNPRGLYPKAYWDAVGHEQETASGLVDRYNKLRNDAAGYAPGSPGRTNTTASQRLVVDQAKALFDSIHLGRRAAFGPGGSGYGDFANFRWQAAKENGTVSALRNIAQAGSNARQDYETGSYGTPLDATSALVTRAALWQSRQHR